MHIGIIGHMGHGKTSMVGRWLAENGYIRFHPAETLRKMLVPFLLELGYTLEEIPDMLEGSRKREELAGFPGITPTTLQQDLGTAWGREKVNPEIWNYILERRIGQSKLTHPYGPGTYNDSIRFPDEAERVLSQKGILIRVERPGHPVDLSHVSEQHIPTLPWHFEVVNRLDYAHVSTQMRSIMDCIHEAPSYDAIPLRRYCRP